MIGEIVFIPIVTTSRKEFVEYIKLVCEDVCVDKKSKKEWVKRVVSELHEAHYFIGVIFVERVSFYLILHELVHHIATLLKALTQSAFWYNLDYLIDELDIFLFRK